MKTSLAVNRQTKYCLAIQHQLEMLGHATNAELLGVLRQDFPNLSATTVHRATARLADRGIIGLAPQSSGGALQYDANIQPHDHFQCTICGRLKDTDIKGAITPILEASIDGCHVSGRLTINGVCKNCIEKE